MSRCRDLSSLTEPPLGLMVRAARATEYTHIRWKIGGRMCLTSPQLVQGCRRLTLACVQGDVSEEDAALDADEPNLTPGELASVEAKRRELFAALRTRIITTSLNGKVNGFNDAATARLGGPARLYNRPIQELLPFVSPPSDTAAPADSQGRAADATGHTV